MLNFSDILKKILLVMFTGLITLLLWSNIRFVLIGWENQYYLLAQSFLHGKLYFIQPPNDLGDTVFVNEKYYWPNPPFPAILMMPFIIVLPFVESYMLPVSLNLMVLFGIVLILHQTLKGICNKKDINYWIFTFMFSTVFFGVAATPTSWYFAHTLSVFLIFVALLLYKKGVPIKYIGLIYGLIAMTRFTAAVGIVYFLLMIFIDNIVEKRNIARFIKKSLELLLPFLMLVTFLFLYNYARYGTWQELGYLHNKLHSELEEGRSYGLLSPKHVPGNLYYLFLNTPKPIFVSGLSHVLQFPYLKTDPWGMSIFVTSPFFLLLFTYTYKRRESIVLLLTSIIVCIPILLYFGIGWYQFGYRYSTDFLPYLFILLVSEYTQKNKELSNRMKLLIILTAVSNTFLYFTIL